MWCGRVRESRPATLTAATSSEGPGVEDLPASAGLKCVKIPYFYVLTCMKSLKIIPCSYMDAPCIYSIPGHGPAGGFERFSILT